MSIRSNKKVIIPAVAVVAAAFVGLMVFSPSLVFAQNSTSTAPTKPTISGTINVPQLIQSQVKVSFSDAANTAAKAANGTVIAGHLGVAQGYLVYTFTVLSNNQIYNVVVDPGNGTVLYQSQGHALGHGMFGGAMMKHHGFGGMWREQANSQPPPAPSQSGITSPGWMQTQY